MPDTYRKLRFTDTNERGTLRITVTVDSDATLFAVHEKVACVDRGQIVQFYKNTEAEPMRCGTLAQANDLAEKIFAHNMANVSLKRFLG